MKGVRAVGSGRERKLRRSIYLLPSMFTVGNIFAGFYAVISTLHGDYDNAAVAIGIAVVLDGLDGRIARLAGATSDFGVQLDSLADVISFGIAPSVLIYSWGLEDLGNFSRLAAFVFLICGAMRLARFNIQTRELKHFAGLPIPAGAGMIAATVHLFKLPPESDILKICLVAMTYLLALLMISTLRYPSMKHLPLTRGRSHLNVLFLALVLAGVIWYSEPVLMGIAVVYVSSGLVTRVYQMLKYRSKHPDAYVTQPERK
ncbi:MAG: CDP-diacylglycerol--serine O-phosphatidyltransferase [Acidobacteriota bacterium]|nr:MAG: CDP-diacylglycerol--serine O-phosphatidyltransferase [Acidobacteriota bacterium]